jgi:hypothetical protein
MNYVGPPKTLENNDTKAHNWCFKKFGLCSTGSCGVFSYNMENKDKNSIKLNIMWSAPFNHDHYCNWFAIGVSKSKASEELFKKMYYAENLEGFNRRPSVV